MGIIKRKFTMRVHFYTISILAASLASAVRLSDADAPPCGCGKMNAPDGMMMGGPEMPVIMDGAPEMTMMGGPETTMMGGPETTMMMKKISTMPMMGGSESASEAAREKRMMEMERMIKEKEENTKAE